jgi:formamidopyrimidine-DNA glycosylase
MPEGPEVRITAEELKHILAGCIISDIANSSGKVECAKYCPLRISDISNYGKLLWFQLQSCTSTTEDSRYLTTNLGLEGMWRWRRSDHTHMWLSITIPQRGFDILCALPPDLCPEEYECRTHQDTGEHVYDIKLYYNDVIGYGLLDFYTSTASLQQRIQSCIGYDLLQHVVNLVTANISMCSEQDALWPQYVNYMKSPRLSSRLVCRALVDQKKFSGIGNYLRAEIMYYSRITPNRPLGSLNDTEIRLLYSNSLSLIYHSYRSKGATLRSYRSPLGNYGAFKVLIYDQKYDPYGNEVQSVKYKDNEQTVYWVPKMQV